MKTITKEMMEEASQAGMQKTFNAIIDAQIEGDSTQLLNVIRRSMTDEFTYSFENQSRAYPSAGPTGISYFKGIIDEDKWVDCLLRYDDNGALIGILNYYPMDLGESSDKGTFIVFVKPSILGKGIAKELIEEGMRRFNISPKVVEELYNIQNPIVLQNLL